MKSGQTSQVFFPPIRMWLSIRIIGRIAAKVRTFSHGRFGLAGGSYLFPFVKPIAPFKSKIPSRWTKVPSSVKLLTTCDEHHKLPVLLA